MFIVYFWGFVPCILDITFLRWHRLSKLLLLIANFLKIFIKLYSEKITPAFGLVFIIAIFY